MDFYLLILHGNSLIKGICHRLAFLEDNAFYLGGFIAFPVLIVNACEFIGSQYFDAVIITFLVKQIIPLNPEYNHENMVKYL